MRRSLSQLRMYHSVNEHSSNAKGQAPFTLTLIEGLVSTESRPSSLACHLQKVYLSPSKFLGFWFPRRSYRTRSLAHALVLGLVFPLLQAHWCARGGGAAAWLHHVQCSRLAILYNMHAMETYCHLVVKTAIFKYNKTLRKGKATVKSIMISFDHL